MIVMKFGGTSIQNPEACKQVINIISNINDSRKIIVFSAMGKTTRKLLALSQSYADQKNNEVKIIFNYIRFFHEKLMKSLISENENKVVIPLLEFYFNQIKDSGEEIQKVGKLEARMQDKLLSYGELLSTTIMTSAMRSQGIHARLMDARECIITDSTFTCAKPLIKQTYEKVNTVIPEILENREIPVIQGFIGSDIYGETTTLGFEGSDLTASLIGAALEVNEIQIWKDVSGIMTADPCVYSKSKCIDNITFQEAYELSRAGAKVLHPRTTTPASEKGIPIRIKNSAYPENRGTLISNEDIAEDLSTKSIVCKVVDNQTLISLIGRGISFNQDLLDNILKCLKNFSFRHQENNSPDVLTFIFDKSDTKKVVEILHEVIFKE